LTGVCYEPLNIVLYKMAVITSSKASLIPDQQASMSRTVDPALHVYYTCVNGQYSDGTDAFTWEKDGNRDFFLSGHTRRYFLVIILLTATNPFVVGVLLLLLFVRIY